MPEYTPLDSLKEAFHVVRNLIGRAQEDICDEFDDDSSAQLLLDAAKAELVKAIARHVPGIHLDDLGMLAQDNVQANLDISSYDDGTLIKLRLTSDNGWMVQDYYPRRDGSRWGFLERLNAMARKQEADARVYAEALAAFEDPVPEA